MNLPLPELFYWGSRPKNVLSPSQMAEVCTANKKHQRQGSPHRACRCWQLGSLSAAAVICQHTPQNPSPAPAMGAKYIPWWVQNTGTASPTLCALEFARASQLPALWQRSGSLPLLPADWRWPNTEPLHPRDLQRGCRIYSRSAFPVIPSMSRGFTPPDQFRPGLRELSKLPSLPWPHREPQEKRFLKGTPFSLACGTSAPLFVTLEWLTECFRGATPAAIVLWNWAFLNTRSFRQSLALASLASSAERFGLQDRSLVRAAWNMPSPVQFQLCRLVSFFGIWWLPKQDSTSC